MPMRVIAKKRCRAMVEPPEKRERATLNPNLTVATLAVRSPFSFTGSNNCAPVALNHPSDFDFRHRACTMREEFASKSFLAVTIAGLAPLCSGLISIAFT